MTLTIAIVGRPNVGKSTLFNRLAKKKMAIVDDRPGVTRDWREAPGWLLDQPVRLLDTAGLEDRFDGSMESRMRKQTEAAIEQADAVLFVVDGRDGITPVDRHFAQWLRKSGKPIVLAVNKCDHQGVVDAGTADSYALGLGEPVPISSAHGFGLEDLYEAFRPFFKEEEIDEDDGADRTLIDLATLDDIEGKDDFDFAQGRDEEDEKPIKVAIVGRPNAGKSTLMNALLGFDRVMTGPEAGMTRDAIAAAWEWQGRKFRLVDTAGLRRKARINDRLEQMSVDDTLRAIRLAHVVLLVIDAERGIDTQDLQIARHIEEEGRMLIVVVNKWDLITDKQKLRDEFRDRFNTSLGQLPNVPMVTISAENKSNLDTMMKAVMDNFVGWIKRVPTAGLNKWLDGAVSHHPPPLVGGRPNSLRYMAQINIKPPTFVLWCVHPKELPDAYQRYLINGLRERYGFPPVPIRLLLRKSKNPYADRKK